MEPNLGARRNTKHVRNEKALSKASKIMKSKSPCQTDLSLHQMNTLMIFKNKGSLLLNFRAYYLQRPNKGNQQIK